MKPRSHKQKRDKGHWQTCEVCGQLKEGVQIRKAHLHDTWACDDCYEKAKESDKTFSARLKFTKPQWKHWKRESKEL